MQIKDLSIKTDISISTIRYYEKLKLIKPNKPTYYKVYDENIKETLLAIKKLKNAGLKLKDIQAFISIDEKEPHKLENAEIDLIIQILNDALKQVTIKQEEIKQSIQMILNMLSKVHTLK